MLTVPSYAAVIEFFGGNLVLPIIAYIPSCRGLPSWVLVSPRTCLPVLNPNRCHPCPLHRKKEERRRFQGDSVVSGGVVSSL